MDDQSISIPYPSPCSGRRCHSSSLSSPRWKTPGTVPTVSPEYGINRLIAGHSARASRQRREYAPRSDGGTVTEGYGIRSVTLMIAAESWLDQQQQPFVVYGKDDDDEIPSQSIDNYRERDGPPRTAAPLRYRLEPEMRCHCLII